jgi:hypothetical protein
LSTAELAVASRFGTLARSAIDSLATGESAQRALAALRSSFDALLIAQAVSAVRSTGTFTRIALDALGTAEAAIRTLAVTRGTTDALAITQAVTIGRSFARTTIDHLSTLETCVAIVQVGGPWEYVLPFPTGNSPLISNLQYVDP